MAFLNSTKKSLLITLFLFLVLCTKQDPWHIYNTANTPLTSARIRQTVLENNKLSWVGTYGGGLYRIENDTWKKVASPFQGDYILSLKKDTRGGLWIGTARNGAFYYHNNTWKHLTGDQGLAGNNVWDIFLEDEETIWFCSRYRGVCRKSSDSILCMDTQNGLPDRQVTVAQKDKKGEIWFGTVRGGLAGYKDEQFEYINTRNGLSGNYIRALICDTIPRWVGSWDGGLDFFTGENWKHITEVGKPVVFLGFDKNKKLWAGTWGKGVFYKESGKWHNLTAENSDLPDNYVIDIDFTDNGTVYFSTSKGVAVYAQ